MTKRTETIGIRVVPEVKAAVTAAAGDVNRSVASLVETILIEHLLLRGYLDADQPVNGNGAIGHAGESADRGFRMSATRGATK